MSVESPKVPALDQPIVNAEPTLPKALPRRRKKSSLGRWLGLGLLAIVVVLVASTIRPGQGAFTYSKYVDEVLANPQRFYSMELRVEGIVAAGSIENRPGSRHYRFRIDRNGRSMPVTYTGIVPDTFREGIGVTVRGRLGRDGVFAANEVVAKCPSKYEMQAARARGQGPSPGHPTTSPH